MQVRAMRLAVIAAPALLGACSMAPAYHPPQTIAPQDYKEVAGWTQATPLDTAPRSAWWEAFNDPILNDLEVRAEKASPTLAAALARYDRALAAARVERADLFPTVAAGSDASRQRVSGRRFGGDGNPRTYNDFSIGGALDYEIDLWGRIRNGVASARADAEASEADLASARLSLQAAVADAYARLRGLDAQADLLRQTVDAFGKAYDLTVRRHDGGIASGIDVNRAQTVLGNARAQISAVAAERAATEHEIAALVGELASDFSIAPQVQSLDAPALPAGTPSSMLQRRPDIAAAERRVAEANDRVGIARAAFFPTLSLGASVGYESTALTSLISRSSFL
ncbi:MAG TPA: efflux transporter outer membrane subunit, partial [Sphingopyxis sp.]|uniref:efflux transporter outer membrane subunit n=1 Tax=Sphingopyxis sp. TaxID=1908224 RepID=UPI002CECAE1D